MDSEDVQKLNFSIFCFIKLIVILSQSRCQNPDPPRGVPKDYGECIEQNFDHHFAENQYNFKLLMPFVSFKQSNSFPQPSPNEISNNLRNFTQVLLG